VDRVHGAVDRGQRAWRASPTRGARALELAGARVATEGEDEPVEAVLGRCSLATEAWQRGGAPEAMNGGGLSSS
jgi:hypothetical protein